MRRFFGVLPNKATITVAPSDLSSEKLKVWLSSAGPKPAEVKKNCTIEGCTAKQVGFGHCEGHYGK